LRKTPLRLARYRLDGPPAALVSGGRTKDAVPVQRNRRANRGVAPIRPWRLRKTWSSSPSGAPDCGMQHRWVDGRAKL